MLYPNHCKSAQSQPQFVTSGSQTLISGNINESSFSSVDSYVNVCDSIILIRLIVIQIYIMLAFLKIRMSLIMSLNEEILSNIKTLQKVSEDNATGFTNSRLRILNRQWNPNTIFKLSLKCGK